MRANGGIGCCSSSFSAPLCRSPDTRRIATNGRRNAAASSHALNVGDQTPTRGENASPTPSAVPFSPLRSAYVRTALMNETPTSGPIATSRTHHDFDATSSRHSFAASARHAPLGERKEDLLEIARRRQAGELVERPFA